MRPNLSLWALPFAALALLIWLALVGLTGCAAVRPMATPAIITAGCVLIDRLPASAGYLTAAATAFRTFADSSPPTPAALETALAAIPNSRLTVAQQRALWAATVAAYSAAWSKTRSEADTAALRGDLRAIADALQAAVDTCAPQLVTSARALDLKPKPAIDEQGLFDLSATIAKQLP